jgi:hypothetical protein
MKYVPCMSFSRTTLTRSSREEILALCSEAAETTDSPDLGPPPVSRFVDEDPVKLDLPTKLASTTPITPAVEEPLSKGPSITETPQLISSIEKEDDVPRKVDPMVKKTETKPIKTPLGPDPQTALQIAKSNLKRKMREDDEKENAKGVKIGGSTTKSAKGQPEKSSQLMGRPINRIIKDPASIRREAREKAAAVTPSVVPRKPLGSRNTNEAVTSPKKSTKAPMMDEVAKAKAEAKDHNELQKDRMKPKRRAEASVSIQIPTPEPEMPAPVTTIELESEAFSAEPNLSAPDSPEPSAPWEEMRDTPPPTDISSRGETSRGSRRARTAVSYAEPNLRDKMRRPTKQLFDAVAGEGKAMRRVSHSKANDMPSIKSEEKSQGWKDLPNAVVAASDITASPLAQKISRALSSDDLPTAVVTDRKRHISAIEVWGDERQSAENALAPSKSTSKPMNRRLEEIAAREVEVAKMFDQPDVYEFTISSPTNDSKNSTPEDDKTSSSLRHGKSRRQSSTVREDIGQGDGRENHEKVAQGRSRKRSSMMVQKVSAIEAESITGRDSPADGDSLNSSSPAEAGGSSARDRASTRRRSMML